MAETGSETAPGKLTARQQRFVEEYLKDLNATKAAARAGYSAKTSNEQGSRLLANASVAEAIAKAKAARSARTEITQDRVLKELARLAFSDVRHYTIGDTGLVDLAEGAPEDAHVAVSTIEREVFHGETGTTYKTKVKLWDKPGMLRLAGKHVGIKGFADQLEVKGDGVAPVVHVYTGIAPPPDAEPEDGGKGGA